MNATMTNKPKAYQNHSSRVKIVIYMITPLTPLHKIALLRLKFSSSPFPFNSPYNFHYESTIHESAIKLEKFLHFFYSPSFFLFNNFNSNNNRLRKQKKIKFYKYSLIHKIISSFLAIMWRERAREESLRVVG